MSESPTLPPPSTQNLTVLNAERLHLDTCALLIPNQLNFPNLLRLRALIGERPIRYLVDQGAALDADLKAFLDRDDTEALGFAASSTDPTSLREALTGFIGQKAAIVYLPARAATVNAPATTVPGNTLELLMKLGLPVLPLYIHHAEDVALSTQKLKPNTAVVAVGRLLIDDELTLANYQESLFALAECAFDASPLLETSLPYALIQGMKKHGNQRKVVDGKDGRDLPFSKVLAAALALSSHIKKHTTKERVGIVMPPSLGGLIANVAVLLANKTPVNFNFTAGHAAIQSAMKRSGIDRIITADPVVRKMQAFPWPPSRELILLERLMPTLKGQVAKWLILSRLLPSALLASLAGVAKKGGHREAVLLFTSGSAGAPKGVALTHRNVMANVVQFGSRLPLGTADTILGSLPLFHSFGCTVTMWYPLIQGLNLVTYPTPLETKKIAELIDAHSVSLLVATPTFLRGYQRGVNREQLNSLKLTVTGAEKLPASVAEAFEHRFGKRVFEGYGLTETTPVTNVNLPDPTPLGTESEGFGWIPAYRFGSVGHLMPGLAVRITHPETFEPVSLHQSGMIWFKGANVFNGYLDDPKGSAQVIDPDGWFRTGDIGRVDMDGFLYIEGRLSRFSKIAGEMVPHETVEEALIKALGLENESVRRLAVVGVPDPEKGEALVLLTTLPGGSEQQEILDLRYRLLDHGVPPLWIPRRLIRIGEVPVLASGKLDVQGCEAIARAAM